MEVRSTEEVKEIILDYAKEIISKQAQKKAIDSEIAEIKQDAKEDGIAISKVIKVISKMKSLAKQSEADLLEEYTIQEMLETNDDIQNEIANLVA